MHEINLNAHETNIHKTVIGILVSGPELSSMRLGRKTFITFLDILGNFVRESMNENASSQIEGNDV